MTLEFADPARKLGTGSAIRLPALHQDLRKRVPVALAGHSELPQAHLPPLAPVKRLLELIDVLIELTANTR